MRLSKLVLVQLLAVVFVAAYEVLTRFIGLGRLTFVAIAVIWIVTVYALATVHRHEG